MRKGDNLPPSCAVVTKYGSLNFLEPSGPAQACNGTALPFTTVVSIYILVLRSAFIVVEKMVKKLYALTLTRSRL